MFTTTKDKALLTTTTGALPRPAWYTENLRGLPLSHGFSRLAYRDQHFDCLACHVAAQHRAGIDIMVDGDTRLDDDVAGRGWVSYVTERVEGIGAPRVEVPPAGFMKDKGPGDLMWEVIETRMTPPVSGKIGKTQLELDRAYKAIAPMTDKPVKIGTISAQILALMLTDEHYGDRLELLMDLSAALNKEYHALADAGAPLIQIEEPAIHQVIADPNQSIKPDQWVKAFNEEVKGLRQRCEVWCHTCWGSPAAQRVASKDQSYKAALPYLNELDVDVITVEGAFNKGMDLEHFGKLIGKDKKIALGVISHRTLQVERPEEIAELIRKALQYIEPERLILTSDCGFGRQGMSRMHAFYKMVALTRGTNIVRKELGLPEAYIPATDPKLSMVPLGA
ncbi:cobalamin-independent methionine synthase II family protein [Microbacteriaceae bacterium K1510]|nr:cobalamin-independent methionine synthase II family protein [Microbacteriaceae bacterium K1510]